ncbi:hypothetical protein EVAR_58230_1 [Eumeta japonica]|uniref:Reverse transcriptase domain-containing protein n=1 Tax=Eumeta variegata TaxID=151549 RepID=A0A4C2AGX3_EUMVA|nr:hypothetical protein EVAR_58230_1 [Eumeta japonica]
MALVIKQLNASPTIVKSTGRDFLRVPSKLLFSSSLERRSRHSQTRETARPPASYRPILSLLSGLAKLFERVLKTRLRHPVRQGLIIDEQFGFAGPLSTASPPFSQNMSRRALKSKQKP